MIWGKTGLPVVRVSAWRRCRGSSVAGGAALDSHGHLPLRARRVVYNFQGLRAYKEKFHPVWEPHYLAYPGGLRLPRILADVSALVAGRLQQDLRQVSGTILNKRSSEDHVRLTSPGSNTHRKKSSAV